MSLKEVGSNEEKESWRVENKEGFSMQKKSELAGGGKGE